MFRGLLRPGQGFRPLFVLKRKGTITATGTPTTGSYEECGKFLGIISQASQTEKEQWKQSGHPISHTIVQRGTQDKAKPTDVLELRKPGEDPRRFLVQGVQDPGELGHFTVYHVEERADLQ